MVLGSSPTKLDSEREECLLPLEITVMLALLLPRTLYSRRCNDNLPSRPKRHDFHRRTFRVSGAFQRAAVIYCFRGRREAPSDFVYLIVFLLFGPKRFQIFDDVTNFRTSELVSKRWHSQAIRLVEGITPAFGNHLD